MNYKIYPVYLGGVDVSMSTVMYRNEESEKMRMVLGTFVLEDENGEYILLDTGAPSAVEIREKGYPFRQMADSVDYIEEIKKLGVDPEKVRLIIFSHLHWDHAWNLEYFPNAEMIVQRTEMENAIHPLKTSLKSYSMLRETGGPNWLKAIIQMKGIEGDKEIRPGLSVITTPGHTCGSQSILINTKDGLYVNVSDMAINKINITNAVPTGTVESIHDWYKSYQRLMELGDVKFLMNHDPDIYKVKVYG